MLVLLQTLLEQERADGGQWWDVPSFLSRSSAESAQQTASASTSIATSVHENPSDGRHLTDIASASDVRDSPVPDDTNKDLEDWLVSGLVNHPADAGAGSTAIDEFKRKSREYFLKRLRSRVFQDVSRDAAVPLPTDDVIALPIRADRASVVQREPTQSKRTGEPAASPPDHRTGLSEEAVDAADGSVDGAAASARAGQAHNWRKASSDASVDFKRKSRVLLLEMLRAKVFNEATHSREAAVPIPTDDVILMRGDSAARRTPHSPQRARSDLPHRRAPTEGRSDAADGAARRAHSPCSVSSRSPHAARSSRSRGGSTGSEEREQARLRCTLHARAGAGEVDVETFLAEESEAQWAAESDWAAEPSASASRDAFPLDGANATAGVDPPAPARLGSADAARAHPRSLFHSASASADGRSGADACISAADMRQSQTAAIFDLLDAAAPSTHTQSESGARRAGALAPSEPVLLAQLRLEVDDVCIAVNRVCRSSDLAAAIDELIKLDERCTRIMLRYDALQLHTDGTARSERKGQLSRLHAASAQLQRKIIEQPEEFWRSGAGKQL